MRLISFIVFPTRHIVRSTEERIESREDDEKKKSPIKTNSLSDGSSRKMENILISSFKHIQTAYIHILKTDYFIRIRHFDELWNYIAVKLRAFDDIHAHDESNWQNLFEPVFCDCVKARVCALYTKQTNNMNEMKMKYLSLVDQNRGIVTMDTV